MQCFFFNLSVSYCVHQIAIPYYCSPVRHNKVFPEPHGLAVSPCKEHIIPTKPVSYVMMWSDGEGVGFGNAGDQRAPVGGGCSGGETPWDETGAGLSSVLIRSCCVSMLLHHWERALWPGMTGMTGKTECIRNKICIFCILEGRIEIVWENRVSLSLFLYKCWFKCAALLCPSLVVTTKMQINWKGKIAGSFRCCCENMDLLLL